MVAFVFAGFVGEPGGTRTRDPVIKSHMLYHLSYRLAREISMLTGNSKHWKQPRVAKPVP